MSNADSGEGKFWIVLLAIVLGGCVVGNLLSRTETSQGKQREERRQLEHDARLERLGRSLNR